MCTLVGCTPSFNHPLRIAGKSSTNASPCFEQDYANALTFADRSIAILNRYDGRQERIRVGEGVAALGISTTAAGVAAFSGGKDLLRGLAIGGATVLGFDAILAPARKSAIINSGRKALYCAVRSAQAVHLAPATRLGSAPSALAFSTTDGTNLTELSVASGPPATGVVSRAASALSAQSAFLGSSPGRVIGAQVNGDTMDLASLGAFQVIKAANAQVEQEKAVQQFVQELIKQHSSAATRLSLSVCQINDEIAAQLRSSAPSPEAIIKKQQEVVSKQLEGLIKKNEEVQEAAEETATPNPVAPAECAKAGETPATCKAKSLALDTVIVQRIVADAQAVYEECVKLSDPPKN